MNSLIRVFTALSVIFLAASCGRPEADLILYNGVIHTVDDSFRTVNSVAVRDGKILAVGPSEVLMAYYAARNTVDLKGAPVYPGLIDAHSHFFSYASDLLKLDLTGTHSFGEILDSLSSFSRRNKFEWLLGRGWDQNDWERSDFPDRTELDRLFPDQPVFLVRIDGHAALCNGEALRRAGIDGLTRIDGGEIITVNGIPTGMMIDNAVDRVQAVIPSFPAGLNEEALKVAQKNCFKAGLTTVSDAGLGLDSVRMIERMQREGSLKLRVNVMLSDRPNTLDAFLETGPLVSERLTARAIKVYADGALGSRGALLKQPYADREGHFGLLLHKPSYFDAINEAAIRHGFQVCTHAIGDSAVSLILQAYGRQLRGKNDRRWRIEHCQVTDPGDLHLFSDYSVIPSVQPTHATSDMYWAESRLGSARAGYGYCYRQLLESAGTIAFGTDFPVERIDPLLTFYAAVARKDEKGFPQTGYRPEGSVDRRRALVAMTAGAAYANFEERVKGTLTPGKYADFVILDRDILTVPEDSLPGAKVIATYLAGEKVY
ncbi:MAG: hypothetical protein RL213_293 [Bacteroidota bacterium]|jgi:predicted amidohydrolase YtcJ